MENTQQGKRPVSLQPPALAPLERLLLHLYAALLLLYPRSFRQQFATEMKVVFTAALRQANREGGRGWLPFLIRELLELPVVLFTEYINVWRKMMSSTPLNQQMETRAARWTARLFSLLLFLFMLSLFMLNEDVRVEPSFPLVLLQVLSVGLLVGWRHERFAAWTALGGAPLLFASLLIHGRSRAAVGNWLLLLAVAASLAGALGLIGWLYASVHQVGELAGERPSSRARLRWILLPILAGVAAWLLFGVSWVEPVSQEISAPSSGNAEVDEVTRLLRARGAIIGIGSPPVTEEAFAVPGTILLVNEDEVWLFAYEDVAAATADASAIYYGKRPFHGSDLIQHSNLLLAFPTAGEQTRALLQDVFGPTVGWAE